MYTVEIDFQTEKEQVHLTHGKFASPEEGAAFALSFIKPYIENCMQADGEWRVFDTDHPQLPPEQRYAIRSIRSPIADGIEPEE